MKVFTRLATLLLHMVFIYECSLSYAAGDSPTPEWSSANVCHSCHCWINSRKNPGSCMGQASFDVCQLFASVVGSLLIARDQCI